MNKLFYLLMKMGLFIVPKNKRSIYMKQSMPFKDNIAAVLDEMIKNGTVNEYKIYLHGNNLSEYCNKNIKIVKPNSFLSIWRYLRAKFVICDNGLYGSIYTPRQTTINVTHGMLCKSFGYLTKDSFPERTQCSFLPHRTSTYVISSSYFFVDVWSLALGVPKNNILITGLPRNDYFESIKDNTCLYNKLCCNYKKSIIWMPTYRNSSVALSKNDGAVYELGIPLLTNENLTLLDVFLQELDVVLVIKYHSLQDRNNSSINSLKNIVFIDSEIFVNEEIPLYSFLKSFDALITDYSSVYFDYLILDRPICHVVDDYDEYSKTRGFAFPNTIEILPGELIYSFDNLLNFIDRVSKGEDVGADKRRSLSDQYLCFKDCSNAKRLLESVGIK